MPDECDIAAGRSRDCNNDVLPDECFPERGCDFDITPPTVGLTTVVAAVVAGGSLEFRLSAEDNLNLASRGLLRDGVPIALNAFNVAQVPFPVPGRSVVRGFAVDAAGNQASTQLEVRVLPPLGDAVGRPSRAPGVYGMCDPNSPCPVARVAQPVIEVAPGGAVLLDGGPSTGAVAWRWAVRRAPVPVGLVEAFPGDPGAGGPEDDPATPTAQVAIPEPGRYEIDLTVESAAGRAAPSAQCPSAATVVVIARADAPVRAAGGGCDPTGGRERCEETLVCRLEAEDDGVGQCGERWIGYGEREPDAGPDDLTTLLEGPDMQVIGRLDPCVGDFRDLYGLLLDRAGLYTVEVTDHDGQCVGDTVLTRLDTQVLETRGLATALLQPVARDD
ncbi:MAG: hypothetical protein KC613_24155, partial [Myxococcales bacterium]|nr:hypothetical protein [Myxococcales bacterium]